MGDNRFEVEVRALVPEDFRNMIISRGAKIGTNDPYEDNYYKPVSRDWDPEKITMRLRKSSGKDFVEIIFSNVEYLEKSGLRMKRSVYPEGKIKLFAGSEKTAKQLLKDCGFDYWFTVKKTYCAVCRHEGVDFALENIDGFGWTIEIEGDGSNPDKAIIDLWNKLKKLRIEEEQFLNSSLPKAVAVRKGLI